MGVLSHQNAGEKRMTEATSTWDMTTTRRRVLGAAIVATALLCSCSSLGPRFAPLQTDPRHGVIYVLRASSLENIAVSPEMTVDGVAVGPIASGSHIAVVVRPGRHRMAAAVAGWSGVAQLTVAVDAGRSAFVLVWTTYDRVSATQTVRRFQLIERTAEMGQREIDGTQRTNTVDLTGA